jgi:hypothetical protein
MSSSPNLPMDGGVYTCYPIRVPKRVASFLLVLTVAFAYATGGASTAPTLRAGTATLAGESQPAVCPVTRPSLHLGRQVEGRGSMPLGMPAGLPPDHDSLAAQGWARARVDIDGLAQPQRPVASSCSPRGPPAAGLRHLEA